ncbi:MAG TPA: TetR/AcrR family transcriptional regulator [Candidatus Limnocylindrales bacterium]|nr:TetR/AcrR family transcriptional regulator [Candidatus Limnocylindrales bacterium]
MARTLDPEAHAIKRDAFLDAAQQLIMHKGYEGTSVQDVLQQVNTSKGAFYHYFDSKGSLLNGVVERMVDAALFSVQPVVNDPELPATDKLRGLFAGIASFKTARKELLIALMEVWLSDNNAIVREKFRRDVVERLTPIMASIIRQGHDEGVFAVSAPDDAAGVFVSFLLSLNQSTTELYLARQARNISLDDVRRTLDAQTEALERVLGAPSGSITLIDESVIREWFD